MNLSMKVVSSLDKVFQNDSIYGFSNFDHIRGFRNEPISFQLLYTLVDEKVHFENCGVNLSITGDEKITNKIHVRHVEYIPSAMPNYHIDIYSYKKDNNILKDEVTQYPDLLTDCNGTLAFTQNILKSLWITIESEDLLEPGIYDLTFSVKTFDSKTFASIEFSVEVINECLPDLDICHTEWFHVDCLADYYKVKPYSEAHFSVIGNFMESAVKRNINTIFVPLFTPSLDVEPGFYRTDVQLLKIVAYEGDYQFDFSLLEEYIDLALEKGFKFFEISHLFSQWGAKYTPVIYAEVDGTYKKLFDWYVEATADVYKNFLDRLLPELDLFLVRKRIKSKTLFHISDEPIGEEGIDNYGKALNLVKEHLKDYTIIDAVSDIDIYNKGYIQSPVTASDHLKIFLETGIDNLWTYYCCVQNVNVPNRFFSMPSARNRILGVLLYKYKMKGFLHYGFNFFNTQKSLRRINPYICTDAEYAFPSGDAYLVYPEIDGTALESIRLMVLNEAFNDFRALRLLEQRTSRDVVLDLISLDANSLTFSDYPRDKQYLLNLKERIIDTLLSIKG